ncbi:hypothetical protein [Sideroxydans lithotrophicus]|nr:hypothetical protein [Sideroxydans lithotrophicus]
MRVDGWVEWHVDNNNFYQADRFEVSFAVSALPADRGIDWFALQQEISVEIFGGFPADPDNFYASELQSWIYGFADEVEESKDGRTIHLHGRDLTAKMIDAKTTNVYVNRTASDIAIMLATKYGLTPVVTKTIMKAGKYYELAHAHLHVARSEWDLLTFLAQQEQFVVYMLGRELHFEPMPDLNSDPYVFQWGDAPLNFNGSTLRFRRGLTLAKGIQVTVQSLNQHGKPITAIYPKTAGANAQKFSYRFANLTPEKALQKAQALYHEIVRHEVNLSASMPADNLLTTRNIIKVNGTNTAYDQTYYPDHVRRSMSFDGGYSMEVTAKNQSPQTQVTI